MKLNEVAPHINPDGDSHVCHDVSPMSWRIGLIVLCDRKPKHTGKHMHRTPKGSMEWWGGGGPVMFKNKTLAEAYEALEEAVADLVYFKVDPAQIKDAVNREIVRSKERMEP